jgi:hypothetical protein
MRVTLAVPKLLAVERSALAGVPALARLDRYAGPFIAEPRGFDAALLVAAGQSRDAPTAPLAALGAGFRSRRCVGPARRSGDVDRRA